MERPDNYQKLEDDIMAVWGVKDVVSTFLWRYLDHPRPMTEDEVWNHVYSIECLLDLHCEKLMDTYCQVFQLNEYASDEAKAKRAEMLAKFAEHMKPKKKPATKKVKKK